MSTTLIIAGVVILGLAAWKGRKILISKDNNGDYQLEISKLKKQLKDMSDSNYNNYKALSKEMYKNEDLLKHITTKGMNMKKLRGIIKNK